ncbi:MAG: hypothetical protein KDD50_14310, partial [Bdellovibrionales bacterium]|nr:hypothetical protein [Bdellovibrionales bacterium]
RACDPDPTRATPQEKKEGRAQQKKPKKNEKKKNQKKKKKKKKIKIKINLVKNCILLTKQFTCPSIPLIECW